MEEMQLRIDEIDGVDVLDDLDIDYRERDLEDLAVDITALHMRASSAFRSGLDHAIGCGFLLIEAKRRLGYGKFLPWVAANTTVSARCAQNYTRLARNTHRFAHLDVHGVHEALSLLAEPLEPDEFPSVDTNPDNVITDYCCPWCSFAWSGDPKPNVGDSPAKRRAGCPAAMPTVRYRFGLTHAADSSSDAPDSDEARRAARLAAFGALHEQAARGAEEYWRTRGLGNRSAGKHAILPNLESEK